MTSQEYIEQLEIARFWEQEWERRCQEELMIMEQLEEMHRFPLFYWRFMCK